MKKNNGQTLIELLIALATAVIIVTSITFAVISALRNTDYGKNQNLASSYAQQGMAIITAMRNTDYANFKSLSQYYCLASTCTKLTSTDSNCWQRSGLTCQPNIGSTFVRQVYIEQNSGTCNNQGANISVNVAWTDGQCQGATVFCHSTNLVSCLTNISFIPTPTP